MYLEHFGLDEAPFRITPHTDFFFDGADRGTTLEGLLYAIQYDEGIVKVSGEVGSGKTMLCRVLMERLPQNVETIYLANPSLTRDEILRAIAEDLKLETTGDSARVLMRELQDHLIASHASGRRVVILIDEAHAMPEDSLEQVRLLSNLETSRHKLLQIVLFGQPELDQMLAATSLRQLRDRITHSFRMRPLTEGKPLRRLSPARSGLPRPGPVHQEGHRAAHPVLRRADPAHQYPRRQGLAVGVRRRHACRRRKARTARGLGLRIAADRQGKATACLRRPRTNSRRNDWDKRTVGAH